MRFHCLFGSALISSSLLAFTGGCTQEISRQQLVDKIGDPHDVAFFGDRAIYKGDKDGYRYVHVRNMFDFWGFLGECDYKIRESEWPMEHPMQLTSKATHWQDVTWMDTDAPAGVRQNELLYLSPSFPIGAPSTQASNSDQTTPRPASSPAERNGPTSVPANGGDVPPANAPATQPSTPSPS